MVCESRMFILSAILGVVGCVEASIVAKAGVGTHLIWPELATEKEATYD